MKRFWDKVNKAGPDDCWEWQAYKTRLGYGSFKFDGKTQLTHRMAYLLTVGDIPTGQKVRHKCDNRACCNPAHLELGTQLENMRDMMQRQRRQYKLSPELVRKAREMKDLGLGVCAIGREIGVSHSTISNLLSGKRWGSVQ